MWACCNACGPLRALHPCAQADQAFCIGRNSLNLQSKRAAQRRVHAMNTHNSIAVGTAAMLCGRVAGLLNLTGRSASVCSIVCRSSRGGCYSLWGQLLLAVQPVAEVDAADAAVCVHLHPQRLHIVGACRKQSQRQHQHSQCHQTSPRTRSCHNASMPSSSITELCGLWLVN